MVVHRNTCCMMTVPTLPPDIVPLVPAPGLGLAEGVEGKTERGPARITGLAFGQIHLVLSGALAARCNPSSICKDLRLDLFTTTMHEAFQRGPQDEVLKTDASCGKGLPTLLQF